MAPGTNDEHSIASQTHRSIAASRRSIVVPYTIMVDQKILMRMKEAELSVDLPGHLGTLYLPAIHLHPQLRRLWREERRLDYMAVKTSLIMTNAAARTASSTGWSIGVRTLLVHLGAIRIPGLINAKL